MTPTPELFLNQQLPRWQELLQASRNVRMNAYAPYSQFSVGAAVLTESGQIFVGCNVENASYGLTICAERSAVCAAIAANPGKIMAVCVSLTGVAVPCGTCRQFLYEFNPEMLVLLDQIPDVDQSPNAAPELVSLSSLLPRAFRFP